MDQFNFSYFPYTNFNETNLDWIMEHITACGNFWTASQSSLVMDPDRGTGVSFYLSDMTGRPGVPEPQLGDAVFYSEEGITFVAFIDDVVGGGGSNPEFISFRRYRLTGPQGDPGTPGGGGTGLTEDIKEALLQLARKVAYIDSDGASYYQDLYDALYEVEPPATLVSITAVYTQSGTVYNTDNLYSLEDDLVVTATYSDSSTAVIPAADYTLSGSLTVGQSVITVSYGGKMDIFTVIVTENPAPITLVSIDAVYTQSGTVYDTDTLDSLKSDLVITATYSDSSTAVIPAADYTLSGSLTVGQSVITVSYGGKTDTFNVTVTHYVLWVFSVGYSLSKGASGAQAQKIWRASTAARACGPAPIANDGYIFTVTDSSKYQLAAYDVADDTPIETTHTPAVDNIWYQGGSKSISWKSSDSASTPYVWLALKKQDGTSFTAAELADGALAVFTFTRST